MNSSSPARTVRGEVVALEDLQKGKEAEGVRRAN